MLCHQNALQKNTAVVTLPSAADRLMILPEDGNYSQETESRVLQSVWHGNTVNYRGVAKYQIYLRRE